jgi:hypothetical protein
MQTETACIDGFNLHHGISYRGRRRLLQLEWSPLPVPSPSLTRAANLSTAPVMPQVSEAHAVSCFKDRRLTAGTATHTAGAYLVRTTPRADPPVCNARRLRAAVRYLRRGAALSRISSR